MNDIDIRRDLARAIDNELRESPVPPTGEVDYMVNDFTEKVLKTATRLLPPPSRRTPTYGWCADENVRQEMDEAWETREKAWKAWREVKGTDAERGRRKEFARAGRVLKRLQQEGVQRFFDAHARCLEKRVREGDSMGFYAHLKGVNLETSRKFGSQFIRDEQGGLLRDPEQILQRWTRHFQTLLNNSSPSLDPSVVHSLPQLQICHALGELPTREEVVLALRRMANAKAMGPDYLPAELLKLGVRASSPLLIAFHGIIIRIWKERTVPQLCLVIEIENGICMT